MVKYCLNQDTGLVSPSPLPLDPRSNIGNTRQGQLERLTLDQDSRGFTQIDVDFNELPLELRRSLFSKAGQL